MDDLEQQLKRALARQEPPPWFEAKVLSAVGTAQLAPRTGFRMRWASLAVAGGLLIAAVTFQHERQMRERAAGEEAKARLELALKITRVKLQKIDQKVRAIND